MADKRRSPNQRTINHIHKEPCDTNNIYARINKEALFAARRELTDGEFSLWIFFASQSERLTDYDFGPTIIEKELGIKRAKYTSAVDGLVKRDIQFQLREKDITIFTRFLLIVTTISIIIQLQMERNFLFNRISAIL